MNIIFKALVDFVFDIIMWYFKLLQNQYYWILQIQIKNKIENKIKLFQESTATHTKIEIKILTQQTTRKEKKTAT